LRIENQIKEDLKYYNQNLFDQNEFTTTTQFSPLPLALREESDLFLNRLFEEERLTSILKKNFPKSSHDHQEHQEHLPLDIKELLPLSQNQKNNHLKYSPSLVMKQNVFRNIIFEILEENFEKEYTIEGDACNLLQEASENYLIELLNKADKISKNSKTVVVGPTDIQLAKRITEHQQSSK